MRGPCTAALYSHAAWELAPAWLASNARFLRFPRAWLTASFCIRAARLEIRATIQSRRGGMRRAWFGLMQPTNHGEARTAGRWRDRLGGGDELGFGEPSDLGGSDGRGACWWVATDRDLRVYLALFVRLPAPILVRLWSGCSCVKFHTNFTKKNARNQFRSRGIQETKYCILK